MADLRNQQIKDRFQSLLTTSETTSDPTTGTLQNGNGANITALTLGGTLSVNKLIPTGGTATGNGVYLPTTNTLAFSTNGSERMCIDASGNVGIGVSNPVGKLELVQGLNNTIPIFTLGESPNAKRFSIFQETGFAGIWLDSSNINLKFRTILQGGTGGTISFLTGDDTATERLRINSAGNVLIGTSADTGDRLLVNGSFGIGNSVQRRRRFVRYDVGDINSGATAVVILIPNNSLPSSICKINATVLAEQREPDTGGIVATIEGQVMAVASGTIQRWGTSVAPRYVLSRGVNDAFVNSNNGFTLAFNLDSNNFRLLITSTGTTLPLRSVTVHVEFEIGFYPL
jgi:hypothetical protein